MPITAIKTDSNTLTITGTITSNSDVYNLDIYFKTAKEQGIKNIIARHIGINDPILLHIIPSATVESVDLSENDIRDAGMRVLRQNTHITSLTLPLNSYVVDYDKNQQTEPFDDDDFDDEQKERVINDTLLTQDSSKLIYFNEPKISVNKFEDICRQQGMVVEQKKIIFLFPGNKGHHTNSLNESVFKRMFDIKGGSGLAKPAENIGKAGYPVLSLPTKNMEQWADNKEQQETVQQAIEDLYEAVGAGYSLVLPVRTAGKKNKQHEPFFQAPLKHNQAVEPSFWGGVVSDTNPELAAEYINALDKLADFMALSPADRQQQITTHSHNPLYEAYKKGVRHNNKEELKLTHDKNANLHYLELTDKQLKTVDDYEDATAQLGVYSDKSVFIFPGNKPVDGASPATLFSFKGDKQGLASFANTLGDNGFATLELPIRGISQNWLTNPSEKKIVDDAIGNLYKAARAGYHLVLPVRNMTWSDDSTISPFNGAYLPINRFKPPQYFEPAFWGGVLSGEAHQNPSLAEYYIDELTKLHQLLNSNDRSNSDDITHSQQAKDSWFTKPTLQKKTVPINPMEETYGRGPPLKCALRLLESRTRWTNKLLAFFAPTKKIDADSLNPIIARAKLPSGTPNAIRDINSLIEELEQIPEAKKSKELNELIGFIKEKNSLEPLYSSDAVLGSSSSSSSSSSYRL